MGKIRHVLGISGGKDSAALAIYLKEKAQVPEMEYYFADTGCELPETYDFIDKLEVYLGREITRIGSEAPFEHHLVLQGGMLPSPRQRWCTVKMKLEPFERFVGNDDVVSYIAIRADEHREGYISTKSNIKPVFPFVHDDIVRKDVFKILEETVGVPEYYKWRSRSGCYFCFFQQHHEWLGLYDNHPDLFQKAKKFESYNGFLDTTREGYSWVQGITLEELIKKREEIVSLFDKRNRIKGSQRWQDLLISGCDAEDQGCLICSL